MQETILAQANGYDAEDRREVERIVRGALVGGDGFFNTEDLAGLADLVLELGVTIHRGAFAAGQRDLATKRAKDARLWKQAKDFYGAAHRQMGRQARDRQARQSQEARL
jgi:hypothetical protein